TAWRSDGNAPAPPSRARSGSTSAKPGSDHGRNEREARVRSPATRQSRHREPAEASAPGHPEATDDSTDAEASGGGEARRTPETLAVARGLQPAAAPQPRDDDRPARALAQRLPDPFLPFVEVRALQHHAPVPPRPPRAHLIGH